MRKQTQEGLTGCDSTDDLIQKADPQKESVPGCQELGEGGVGFYCDDGMFWN